MAVVRTLQAQFRRGYAQKRQNAIGTDGWSE
jgi:hypothetical protein